MSLTKCRIHDWIIDNDGNRRCLVCGLEQMKADEPTRKVISKAVVDHEKRIRALELRFERSLSK